MYQTQLLHMAKKILSSVFLNPTFDILMVLTLFFTLASPYYLTAFNLRNIALQNAHTIVMMAGIAIIMQGGGLDLSVGYQMSLAAVLTGELLTNGFSVPAAAGAGLLSGVLCGVINGFIVAKWRLSPIIATLATQEFYRGVAYLISGGVTYYNIPQSLRGLTEGLFLGIPKSLWLALCCIAVTYLLFHYTVF